MNTKDYEAIARIVAVNQRTFYVGGHVEGIDAYLVEDLADYFAQEAAQFGQHEDECGTDYPCYCDGQFDHDEFIRQCSGIQKK